MRRPIGALAGLIAAGFVCACASEFPQAQISNRLLRVTLYLPDAAKGYYRGTRFDWSGVIASLEFQGHNYYGPWFQRTDPSVRDFVYRGSEIVAGRSSAATGPAEEFLTDGAALGYDESKPGGRFIKIGVGVLRRPDGAAYDRFRLYEIVDPGRWTVRTSRHAVEFVQEVSDPTSGYAYVYRKTVRLTAGEPEMVLEHSLRNTGRRAIRTSTYNHNFLVLDHLPTGPDFTITLPFTVHADRPLNKDLAEIRGDEIVYLRRLEDQDRVATGIEGFRESPADYDIRIENRRAGAGMRISGDRPLSRMLLWSIRTVLAVEPFISATIEPGEEFTWKLTYRYYTLGNGGR